MQQTSFLAFQSVANEIDAPVLLSRVGLRKTATMIALLQCLARQSAPVTHRYLAEELSLTGHEPSTVFRCLRRFEEKGLVARLDLGEHLDRYELADGILGEETGTHPHFLCTVCGDVFCLREQTSRFLRKSPAELHPKIGEVSRIVLKGRCKNCCRVANNGKR